MSQPLIQKKLIFLQKLIFSHPYIFAPRHRKKVKYLKLSILWDHGQVIIIMVMIWRNKKLELCSVSFTNVVPLMSQPYLKLHCPNHNFNFPSSLVPNLCTCPKLAILRVPKTTNFCLIYLLRTPTYLLRYWELVLNHKIKILLNTLFKKIQVLISKKIKGSARAKHQSEPDLKSGGIIYTTIRIVVMHIRINLAEVSSIFLVAPAAKHICIFLVSPAAIHICIFLVAPAAKHI